HNPDHGERSAEDAHLAANGVLASPEGFGLAFGEDDAVQIAVALFKKAAGNQLLACGLEISGTYPAGVDQWPLLIWPVDPGQELDPPFSFERHGAHQPSGLNAGNGPEIFEDGVVESDAALVGAVGLRGEPDFGDHGILGCKSF